MAGRGLPRCRRQRRSGGGQRHLPRFSKMGLFGCFFLLPWPLKSEEMLENGSNPNYKMPDGSNWTVLMLASNGGHEELVQKFTKGGKGVSDKDPQGFQAIMLAAIKGHANVCRSLLEKKADANACNEDGETPLMMAAAMGHQDLVRLLLDAGADANCQDKNSMSALKKAWEKEGGCCLMILASVLFPVITRSGGKPLGPCGLSENPVG